MPVSRSLDLPDGYQTFDWDFDTSVTISNPDAVMHGLKEQPGPLQLYTQHEIFLDDDTIKHTRSSPNWDGGLVTFATCKHLMRSYAYDWLGTWIVGLCPAFLHSNTVLFAGRVDEVFSSNYELSRRVLDISPSLFEAKSALTNPRGDLYTPSFPELDADTWHNHENYEAPSMHTRSLEFYDKSPGSAPGPVPKWWRDLEYEQHGRRPKVFILRPCAIFAKPMLWTSIKPGRAARRLTTMEFVNTLRMQE